MLDVSHVNMAAVLVAAIAGISLGFLWYSQKVFGLVWANNIETNEEPTGSPWLYLINFVAILLMAYVLAQFIFFTDAKTALSGAAAGFWAWLGFSFSTSIVDYIFARRSLIVYAITYGYHLAALILMGIILALWR